jgi:23S rRNA pseudouridine1911/1915/1917 synthase
VKKSNTDIPVADRVAYEDNHLIVVNKLAGELVQGDHTGDRSLLEKVRTYIRDKYNKPGEVFCGLIHRIDRPTSGLVIFARTSKALAKMNKLFEARAIAKSYYAVLAQKPVPEEGFCEDHLKKNQAKNRSFVVAKETKGAKKARLHYRLMAQSDRYYLVAVELETGRHHQIRVQLAERGWPIRGDLKYGYPRSNHDASISLHAGSLSFTHPIGDKGQIDIKAPRLGNDRVWEFFNPMFTA